MYFVYFLKSTTHQRFYIGSSANVEKRLVEHNQGKTPSTKPYRPWVIVHVEKFDEKIKATKREWHLKHPKGFLEKKAIIEQYKQQPKG